jgi:hypothetical protein
MVVAEPAESGAVVCVGAAVEAVAEFGTVVGSVGAAGILGAFVEALIALAVVAQLGHRVQAVSATGDR